MSLSLSFKKKFDAKILVKSIKTIITELKSKEIDLDSDYQRDIVWDYAKQEKFIDSCFNDIIPNNIIFTLNNCKLICIDGKQRLTSLKNFVNNKFPYHNGSESLYYDKIKKKTKGARKITLDEKNYFYNVEIPIVRYMNLSYTNQIDIFNRIQNGIALSSGELVLSVIQDKKINKYYKKKCIEFKNMLDSKTYKKRKNYVLLYSQLFYIFYFDIIRVAQISHREKLLKCISINDIDNFSKIMNYLEKYMFNKNMLWHKNTPLLRKNLLLSFAYYLYKNKISNEYDLICFITDINEWCQENKIGNTDTYLKSILTQMSCMIENYKIKVKNNNEEDEESEYEESEDEESEYGESEDDESEHESEDDESEYEEETEDNEYETEEETEEESD